jgi:thioredoxin-related protein
MKLILNAALLALALMTSPAGAVPVGDDGLHKPDWLRETFKDMRDDLDEANAEGKRLLVIWEQRGCIYCTRMQEDILTRPEIDAIIRDHFFVVQMNLFGDVEVTDFDGTTRSEKDMALRWGVMFTPTLMFFPEQVEDGARADRATVATMPGSFGPITTQSLFEWVRDKVYEDGENFQRYVAQRVSDVRE